MERLTNEAWRNYDPWELCGLDSDCKRRCVNDGVWCNVAVRIIHLAEYEDTDLTPTEITALKAENERLRKRCEAAADAMNNLEDCLICMPGGAGCNAYGSQTCYRRYRPQEGEADARD
jgi:hypothetical protein